MSSVTDKIDVLEALAHWLEGRLDDSLAREARLREALEYYECEGRPACLEKNPELRLKDGSCIRELNGQCGDIAYEALADPRTAAAKSKRGMRCVTQKC